MYMYKTDIFLYMISFQACDLHHLPLSVHIQSPEPPQYRTHRTHWERRQDIWKTRSQGVDRHCTATYRPSSASWRTYSITSPNRSVLTLKLTSQPIYQSILNQRILNVFLKYTVYNWINCNNFPYVHSNNTRKKDKEENKDSCSIPLLVTIFQYYFFRTYLYIKE